MKKFIIVTLTIFLNVLPAYAGEEYYLRVKVLEGIKQISVSCSGPVIIRNDKTQKELMSKPFLRDFQIKTTTQGLNLDGVKVTLPGINIEPQASGIIIVGKRQYRGRIKCLRRNNNLLIVNELPLEDYLYGVLKHEVSPQWPREALKAQAIIARTFALYNMIEKFNNDYHLTNNVLSQVYAGFLSEDPILTEVIDETRGMILTYDGEVISAYYHATCGGSTENPRNVWSDKNIPYLRIRECSYCQDSPHLYWNRLLSLREITQNFRRHGYNFSQIINIKPIERSPSGRIRKVMVIHSRGKTIIKSNDLRLILGPDVIRSTNFKIKKIGGNLEFRGKGWGHGVGFCQWGARGMALRGFSFDEILDFYYYGIQIEKRY